jgi:CheY-like chemotaxis protein/HPt (histidine-containing phosphotransfer) domain-containing protein
VSETTRVLIVEDDRILRRACEAMLAQHGFAVVTAADGEEGLRRAREVRPDIVLLDMLMPKLNGVDVLRALKADPATAGIPVVILSNSSREDHKEAALALGVTEYYVKAGLSLKDLVALVATLTGAVTVATTRGVPDGAGAESDRPVDLRQLAQRLGDDTALVAETLAGYRADMPARLARLREAVAERDAEAVEHAAHKVQGALLIIGAARAADVARQIERLGERAALAGVDALFESLTEEVAVVAAFLNAGSAGEGS